MINSALINTCRGGEVVAPAHQKSLEEASHTAILVPQRLTVLWVHRLLRIIYTTVLSENGRTGPHLAICLVVWGLVWDGNMAVCGRWM